MPTVPRAESEEVDLFEQAKKARQVGDLEKTVTLLEKAYAATKDPVLLNNIGKVYEEMGQYDNAYKMYLRALNDPNIPARIKTLDESRLERLKPKLAQTQVVVPPDSPWRNVWINGVVYPVGTGIEYAVTAGRFSVDAVDPSRQVLVRMQLEGPPGRRMHLRPSLTQDLDQRFGVISWSQTKAKLKQLRIDEKSLLAPLDLIKGIQLAPGEYTVESIWMGGQSQLQTIVVVAGRGIELQSPQASKRSAEVPVAKSPKVAAQGTRLENVETSARSPSDIPKDNRWRQVGQIGLSLAGIMTSVVGYMRYTDAENRRYVDVEQRQAMRSIDDRPLADNPAVVLESWSQDNRQYTDQMNQGIWLIAGGGLLATGGLTWWLSDLFGESDRTRRVHVKITRNGALVGGEF